MRHYAIGDEVLSGWTITRSIGEGAFGKVYEVEKSGHGITARSALKVVDIPPSESMIASALAEGMDERSVAESFGGIANELAGEISLLESLHHPGIVAYQDHDIFRDPDGVSWRILLRMELLEPLVGRMRSGFLGDGDAARLGAELADALAFCHARGIVHRDIKPENIFVDGSGHFKLGDFGVSRAMEGTQGAFSRKGTESYMAPEVYLGRGYDASVDVYSLGLVLYQLLNRNRLPFLPPAPQPISFHERQSATQRRLSGEALPRPEGCGDALFAIIARMCAMDAADRPSAAEAAAALSELASRPDEKQTPTQEQVRPQATPSIGKAATNHSGTGSSGPHTATTGVWSAFGEPEADALRKEASASSAPEEQPRQRKPRPKPQAQPKERASQPKEPAFTADAQAKGDQPTPEAASASTPAAPAAKPIPKQGSQPHSSSGRSKSALIGVAAAVVVLVAVLALGGQSSGPTEQAATATASGSATVSAGATASGSADATAVSDFSSLDRAEKAQLFARTVSNRIVVNQDEDSTEWEYNGLSREELAQLVAKDSELYEAILGNTSSITQETNVVFPYMGGDFAPTATHVVASKDNAYVIAVEEAPTVDASKFEFDFYGTPEMVIFFNDDDLIEHAYDYSDYCSDTFGDDWLDFFFDATDTAELTPAEGETTAEYELDGFKVELPGTWKLRRYLPAENEKCFGLENNDYYFESEDGEGSFSIEVKTFNLYPLYDADATAPHVIGFSSTGKQVTFYCTENQLAQETKDYILEHITLL